jgi:hypothetical protein
MRAIPKFTEQGFSKSNNKIEYIKRIKDKNSIDWYYISKCQILSEEFIREFRTKVNWYCISIYQKLSEEFIREFKDIVNWYYISNYQKLSEEFIREFKDKVDWNCISNYQKLSEEFIREFKDKVDWYYISKYQKLSEEFIREFKDKVNKDTRLIHKIVYYCGTNNRAIIIYKDDLTKVQIGCSSYTKKEAIKAIMKKYNNTRYNMYLQDYVDKVNQIFE